MTAMSDHDVVPERMGRPRKITAEMAERICDRLAEGETLRRICQDKEFPSRFTVHRSIREDPQFAMQYAIARACALDDKCDEILEIIDGKSPVGSETNERVRLDRDIARCEQHWKHLAMVWPSKYGAQGAGGMAELLPLLEARHGENAKDVTERSVIIEQDPLYASYVAWGRGLPKKKV